jgi:hypothetical protein
MTGGSIPVTVRIFCLRLNDQIGSRATPARSLSSVPGAQGVEKWLSLTCIYCRAWESVEFYFHLSCLWCLGTRSMLIIINVAKLDFRFSQQYSFLSERDATQSGRIPLASGSSNSETTLNQQVHWLPCTFSYVFWLVYSSILKIEIIFFSETYVFIFRTTWRYNQSEKLWNRLILWFMNFVYILIKDVVSVSQKTQQAYITKTKQRLLSLSEIKAANHHNTYVQK